MRHTRFLVCAAHLALALPASAQVSGPVSGVWSAGSTITVVGDLLVPAGQTLTIQPGVTVSFTGDHELVVQGRLDAVGTAAARILFSRSQAGITWGGIRFRDADDASVLAYCHLEHARRDSAIGSEVRGGAISIIDCSPTVRLCEINDNFCGNGSRNGAGAGISIDTMTSSSTPLIELNHFHDNVSDSGGAIATARGGVFSTGTRATIRHNLLEDNSARAYGGALYVGVGSSVVLHGNVFRRNDAGGGGAIAFWQSGGSTSSCNIVAGNTATEGGGYYVRYDAIRSLHDTIAYNTAAEGGGVFVLGDSGSPPFPKTEIVSALVWGNVATGLGGDSIWVYPGVPATLYVAYCDVEGGWPGTANLDVDPLFVDPAAGDFHLSPASPCREHGHPAVPDFLVTDFEGDPRRVGGWPDIGADEITTPLDGGGVARRR